MNVKDIGAVIPVDSVPPSAVDIEAAILGVAMLERDAIDKILSLITIQEVFYSHAHQVIYAAVVELVAAASPVDLLTVTHQLRKMDRLQEIGGPYYLTQLTGKVASGANTEYHCLLVLQKYYERELIGLGQYIQQQANRNTSDVFEMYDDIQKRLEDIRGRMQGRKQIFVETATLDVIDELSKPLSGVLDTGYWEWDMVMGLRPGSLNILAGRPSMGKSALAQNLAMHWAGTQPGYVAFFSLEVPHEEVIENILSIDTGISGYRLKRRDLHDSDWELLNNSQVHKLRMAIYDDVYRVEEMYSIAKALKQSRGLSCIIIDHLQLVESDSKQVRERQISLSTKAIKKAAKRLDVPVILLSQITRESQKRSNDKLRIPQLIDLKESGAIEEDADTVFFPWRPEYYDDITIDDFRSEKWAQEDFAQRKKETPDGDFWLEPQWKTLEGYMKVFIRKHRGGPLGHATLRFDKKTLRITSGLQQPVDINNNTSSLPELNQDIHIPF